MMATITHRCVGIHNDMSWYASSMLGSVFFADDGELSQLDFISVGYLMCIILAIAAEVFHWRLYLTMFVARKRF